MRPVRLTPSVSSQISEVVSVNGADLSTAAAQTSAASGPDSSAAANRRSTSSTLLTSVGTGVASPPASRMPCGDGLEGLAVAGGQDDAGAGGRDRLRGRRSDPAAGAGDDRQASREPMPRLSHWTAAPTSAVATRL